MEPLVVIQIVLEAIVGLLSIVGNSLVLYVISHHKDLQTITNDFIASLAMADLLVGLLIVPLHVFVGSGLPKDFHGCLFVNCLIVILTQVSIFNLIMIAIERFLAIRYPIKHRKTLTHRLALTGIVVAWFGGAIVGSVPMFGWHPSKPTNMAAFFCYFPLVMDMNFMVYFNFFGCVLFPLFIMYAIYLFIYLLIRIRSKQVAPLANENERATHSHTSITNIDGLQVTCSARSPSQERKAAKRIFVILVAFTLCWLPIHLVNVIYLYTNLFNEVAIVIVVVLSHANSAMNPIIYALTHRRFRRACMAALGVKRGGNHSSRGGETGTDNGGPSSVIGSRRQVVRY